jgi:hypothetical protein
VGTTNDPLMIGVVLETSPSNRLKNYTFGCRTAEIRRQRDYRPLSSASGRERCESIVEKSFEFSSLRWLGLANLRKVEPKLSVGSAG